MAEEHKVRVVFEAYLDDFIKKITGATSDVSKVGEKGGEAGREAASGFNLWAEQMQVVNLHLDDTADKAKKMSGIASTIKNALIGIGVAAGTAIITAAAGAVKLGKDVVNQFGELEQNLGGSEAVFGEYAASIQKTGEKAYQNLGVSQSQYLATANKMGALFQGSGVEQQKSLELTEKAMQRAADMASVMGIDMQMALDSVAGAAKGNFTMMDNLGVAMNATNIEAYALAKGLDFAWASASNAEKAEVAMQMFFENTEQYAGNFAKESTQTISGSMGLLKAAVDSLMAGLGNSDADTGNLSRNVISAFEAVVANVVPVLENIVAALPTAVEAIVPAIAQLLPQLVDTATSLFDQVLNTLLGLLPMLIPVAVSAIMTLTNALIGALPSIIEAAIQLVVQLADGLAAALPTLIPTAISAILTIVNGLIANAGMLLQAALSLVEGLAEGLIASIPVLIEALPVLLTNIISYYTDNLDSIVETGINIVIALVMGLIKGIPKLVATLPKLVMAIIEGIGKAIKGVFNVGVTIVESLWKGIANGIRGLNGKKLPAVTVEADVNLLPETITMDDSAEFEPLVIKPPSVTLDDPSGISASIQDALNDVDKSFQVDTDLINSRIQLAQAQGDTAKEKSFMREYVDMLNEKLLAYSGLESIAQNTADLNLLEIAKNNLLTSIARAMDSIKGNLDNINDNLSKMVGAFNAPSEFSALSQYAYETTNNNSMMTRILSTPAVNITMTVKDMGTNSAAEARKKLDAFASLVFESRKDEIIAEGFTDIKGNM